jgi:UDP:flavonoid glycosyltransferase YjiC (YdhE family)
VNKFTESSIMKISIVTIGTRGDVQPYLALGLGLQQTGHEVQIVTDLEFGDFVRRFGLNFAPVEADPRKAVEEIPPNMGNNPIRVFSWFIEQFSAVAPIYTRQMIEACRGTDVILFSSLSLVPPHVAEALGVPILSTFLQAVTPTRAFPYYTAPILPNWFPFRGWFNWLSFRLNNKMFMRVIYKILNECRQEMLGLPPLSWRHYANLDVLEIPILYGFSSHVVPFPKDWSSYRHLTGYWMLKSKKDWQPTPELVKFLEVGPKPVYVGFGSMMDKDVEELTHLVVEALELSGNRGVLLGGWSDLGGGGLPDTILKVDEVPHDWLFPRVAAVVNHGGMGTVAAGLRAGVPTVVIPFIADQPFWGWRVHQLGVGPKPIPRKRLTSKRLAQAIEIATVDEEIRQRASKIGEKMRTEDGVENAVKVIEEYLKNPEQLIFRYEDHI